MIDLFNNEFNNLLTLQVRDLVHGSFDFLIPVELSICSVTTPQCLSGSYTFEA